MIASIDKGLAERYAAQNKVTTDIVNTGNTAVRNANQDQISRDQAAATKAHYQAIERRARANDKQVSPETTKRINDLVAQYTASTDPKERAKLRKDYEVLTSLAATEINKPRALPSEKEYTKGTEIALTEYYKALAQNPDLTPAQQGALATKFGVAELVGAKGLDWGDTVGKGGGPATGGAVPAPVGLQRPNASGAPTQQADPLQQAYEAWQNAKAPWYMPEPTSNSEARRLEQVYTEMLRNRK